MAEEKQAEFVPPRRSFTTEFWVGLFTLAGMACFSYLAINIASVQLTNAGYYSITATFTNVAGLKVGAPVEIAGVRIGQVADVSLDDTVASVRLQIRNEVQLREEDIAQIRTKGIIGDKYVRISPGGSDETLSEGGHIEETESAVEFEEIIGKLIHGLQSGGNDDAAPAADSPAAALEDSAADTE